MLPGTSSSDQTMSPSFRSISRYEGCSPKLLAQRVLWLPSIALSASMPADCTEEACAEASSVMRFTSHGFSSLVDNSVSSDFANAQITVVLCIIESEQNTFYLLMRAEFIFWYASAGQLPQWHRLSGICFLSTTFVNSPSSDSLTLMEYCLTGVLNQSTSKRVGISAVSKENSMEVFSTSCFDI